MSLLLQKWTEFGKQRQQLAPLICKEGKSWPSKNAYTSGGWERSPHLVDSLFPAAESRYHPWWEPRSVLPPCDDPELLQGHSAGEMSAFWTKFSQPILRPGTSYAFSSDTTSQAYHLLPVRRSRPLSCRLWWMRGKWRSRHAESSGGKRK